MNTEIAPRSRVALSGLTTRGEVRRERDAARSQAELTAAAAGRALQALQEARTNGETTVRELNEATRAYNDAQALAGAARKTYEALI